MRLDICVLAFLVMLTLQLSNVINVSWWLICLPLIFFFGVWVLGVCLIGIASIVLLVKSGSIVKEGGKWKCK